MILCLISTILPLFFSTYYFFKNANDPLDFFYSLSNEELRKIYKNANFSKKDIDVALTVNKQVPNCFPTYLDINFCLFEFIISAFILGIEGF
jgi:hypothetical protein